MNLREHRREFGFRIYELNPPLAPGAETTLNFDLELRRNGFVERGLKDAIAENGTCLLYSPAVSYDFFPTIGFISDL